MSPGGRGGRADSGRRRRSGRRVLFRQDLVGRAGPAAAAAAAVAGGFMMGGSATLDPLIGLDDEPKPLRSKLLAVPALRAQYLAYCKQIATKWLDWKTLGPLVLRGPGD